MAIIGYTTGVFDLFHVGHLNILRNAKLECDHLIVGITTDELSVDEKGKSPIIPFSERMTIVESIQYVDSVVPQVNYDKIEAFNNLKFNVMFVGDDWKGTDKWKQLESDFKKLDVKIVYLPYTKQTSSSKLRNILDIIYKDNN